MGTMGAFSARLSKNSPARYAIAVLVILFAPRQIARERTLLERWMAIYSRFNEVLSGIVTVKSFTREEKEKRLHRRRRRTRINW